MKKKKILGIVALALFSLFLFMGCSGGSRGVTQSASDGGGGAFYGKSDQVYYMNVFLPGADYWANCWKGFEAAAQQLGVKIEFTGCQNYDAAEQVETFEQILSMNPSGIVVCPLDADAFKPSIDRAIAMGIPVNTIVTDSPESGRLGNYTFVFENEGSMLAHSMAKLINNEGDILMFTRTQENVARSVAECQRILREQYPRIRVVQVLYADGDSTKAAEITTAALQANPNIKGVLPLAAPETIGVAQAKKETGLNFRIVGVENDPGVLALIKDGLVDATVGNDGYEASYFALINLYISKNKLCQPSTDWEVVNPQFGPLPYAVYFPNYYITKENADKFQPPTWK
jgi:ribose transport system substrate-binding protein